ncbi:UNVERIFIED_CONTAM: hypothetical protein HDU68_001362, partial [Siphonaria sp. JEL0065]
MLRGNQSQTLVSTSLVLQKTDANRVTCPFAEPTAGAIAPTLDSQQITLQEAIQKSCDNIHSLFASTKVNPDRLTYALAGTLFYPWSPKPFGGKKRMKPGFISYQGETAQSLLFYIVSQLLSSTHKRKDLDSILFVVRAINELLELQELGQKDELDERLLKGMKKSGHIQWFGAACIPVYLQHRDEGTADIAGTNALSTSTRPDPTATPGLPRKPIQTTRSVHFYSVRSGLLLKHTGE